MEYIGNLLKKARQEKGLSQRALSKRVGLPQGHISKIESGTVNMQTSSLIELARALDLELMLIPRILVRTVTAITRGTSEEDSASRPMYQLDDVDEEDEDTEDENEE
jgi:HTH-type transcriptional regulator / antitoxin HipB